ncbi:MAG: DinB family protein [Ignavibacteria bacterium]|nr:DinB family protein [Ignavibacteria bacterium]
MPFRFRQSFVLSRFIRRYLALLVADIPDSDLYGLQEQGINSPGWCLGHVAVETDAAYRHLWSEGIVPDEWYRLFYFTSPPLKVTPELPGKNNLTDALENIFTILKPAMEGKPEDFWDQECHSSFLREDLPTEGDWYQHILTTHPAMHAGNIATWRRIRGFGPASYGTQ